MNVLFILASIVAVLSTFMVITRRNAIHALLYLIVSLLATALLFFLLGAAFVAALEVIVYAGAIMVLFVFAVMILNPVTQGNGWSQEWTNPGLWLGPGLLTILLGAELLYIFLVHSGETLAVVSISPQEVGKALYGPYLLGVEMASMLLLSGLIGAYHLGRRKSSSREEGGLHDIINSR